MTTPEVGVWDCEAYGPGAAAIGALCFLAPELHERVCTGVGECAAAMSAERLRVFGVIQEKAAAGDEAMIHLAAEFTHPDQLLGGPTGRGDGVDGTAAR